MYSTNCNQLDGRLTRDGLIQSIKIPLFLQEFNSTEFIMKSLFLFFINLCVLVTCLIGQKTLTLETTTLTEAEVAIGLDVPWELSWAPDNHLWITEREGSVKRLDPQTGIITTVLDLSDTVLSTQESGLLGMAIHPDLDQGSPFVYLVYTYEQGFSLLERLVRYSWDGAVLSDPIILLDEIRAGNIHNGSRLIISQDEKIFMTTGDVGNSDLSQDLESINGKLLRINLDGSIPEDNPNPASYVYSYGHRNSQGLAIGPNGQLYSSEHGAQSSDELNLIEADRNYGWPNVQGACNTSNEINFCQAFNVAEPLIEWSPCVAVNDVAYYESSSIPEWDGKLLMAVLGGFVQQPRLSVLTFNEDGTEVIDEERYFDDYGRIRDICISPNGVIYFATNGASYPGFGPNRIISYTSNLINNTDDINHVGLHISLYPNPVEQSQKLILELDQSLVGGDFQIISYGGKTALSGEVSEQKLSLNTEGLSSGQYYIKVQKEKRSVAQSFVVE